MAGRLVQPTRATVTAATAGGYLTVSAATGLYVGGTGWLTKTDGSLPIHVKIVSISGTTVGVSQLRDPGTGINYGLTDVSAYNAGGFLDQEYGMVYNPNDAPAP